MNIFLHRQILKFRRQGLSYWLSQNTDEHLKCEQAQSSQKPKDYVSIQNENACRRLETVKIY